MKMRPIDFKSLSNLPENLALDFFNEMAIEDKHNFENYKTAKLSKSPAILVDDLM